MMDTVPAKQLGGTFEVAEVLGCTRQQISSLRRREDFPEPVILLRATPIWDLRTIIDFKESWVRRSP